MLRQNLFSKVIFLITSFIFVFFIFDTWELSFKDYQSLESQLESRIQKADELKSEINFIQEKIDDLEDPEKLDIILRQHGYGLPGENIYRFKVPEPVTPLEAVSYTHLTLPTICSV